MRAAGHACVRPWITLAIDVYSRMVTGFYISLDPPGAIATGLCIAHATLPKEAWLAKLGVGGQWSCWDLRPEFISTTPPATNVDSGRLKQFENALVGGETFAVPSTE